VTEEKQLVRTTLYVISPALEKLEKVGRSGLYNPEHNHLFRGKHNREN
ncbi:MAG: precorrin-4 C(11)-methyltransferase, partial [Trichodesmium sp. St2_bin6]|nr:precorrin-4 C(11)-methyltransferase [Trichodesmium sp. St2_bin6]